MNISLDQMKAAVIKAFKEDYVKFDGRVSKDHYWNFLIGLFIVGMVVSVIGAILANISSVLQQVVSGLYSLAVLLPSIGMAIRRMHDTDKSGMYVLINLIPCVGAILFLIQAWKEGNPAANEFGEVPPTTVEVA